MSPWWMWIQERSREANLLNEAGVELVRTQERRLACPHELQDEMKPGVIPWNTSDPIWVSLWGRCVQTPHLFPLYFHLSCCLCLPPFLCPEQPGVQRLLQLLAMAAKPHGWLTTCTFLAPNELLGHTLIWGFPVSKYSLASKPFSGRYSQGRCVLA